MRLNTLPMTGTTPEMRKFAAYSTAELSSTSMLQRLILASLAGLLLGFSFPPLPLGAMAFTGFIPLLLALDGLAGKARRLWVMYACFFCFCGAGNWWVLSWQENTDPYLMLSGAALWLGHPFFFMLPVMAYRSVEKRLGRGVGLALFPVFWTSFEWLHSLTDASYPWLTIGYSQIYHLSLAQIAELGGVWLVSFFVASVNMLLAAVVFRLLEFRRQNGSTGSADITAVFKVLFGSRETLLAAGLICATGFYGAARIPAVQRAADSAPKLSAAVVQPNIDPWKKWEGGTLGQTELHQRLTDSLRRGRNVDLCVWSETAIPYLGLTRSTPEGLGFLQPWADSSGMALLTGFSEIALYTAASAPPTARRLPFDSATYFGAYNSAALIPQGAANGTERPTHRKMKLTPFAERIPFVEYFPVAKKWLEWGVGISDWQKGETQKTLNFTAGGKQARLGCIICIESVYPDFVRSYAANGANVMAIITNDAWYNFTFGPEQHYQIGAMRAIENRRSIIRAANSGESGIILPTGASILRAAPCRQLAVAGDAPLLEETTPYARYGDWLPQLLTALSAAALLYGIFARRLHKNSR